MSATSHNVIADTALRSGLDRLLKLLWKRQRDRAAVGKRKIDPLRTGLLLDSEMSGDGSVEAEVIFCSMMWLGM
jgi:hypothetical protein